MLRWAWRQLTSMRTALFLLLLLAVAAVPGSVFPQRNIDAGRVADYLTQNPTTGPWLDRLGFFDVYSSPWFSAVYLLLFVSLIGCILPRTKLHWRALRATPPRAPRRLGRLAEHSELTTTLPPQEALEIARTVLKSKRMRTHSHDENSVSAESGYLRETGNLVFHLSLTGIIVGMAVGQAFGWRGDLILPEGQTFASTASTYNTFSPGPLVGEDSVPGFVMKLDSLDVTFNSTPGKNFGLPDQFRAQVQIADGPGETFRSEEISVNHPAVIQGADVFLLGNGYAPVITVRDKDGKILYREATPFMAQDGTYRSLGVVKVPAASPKQLGFTGFFLPTAEPTFVNGPVSLFPEADNPELALTLFEGTLFPNGLPQSVYTLNTDEMTQVKGDDGKNALYRLSPGETLQLPDGRGSITFEEVTRFAGLSIRTDPGAPISLVSAILATLGLILALVIKRRRVFVRVRPSTDPQDPQGTTVVSIGGLTKDTDPGLATIIAAVHDRLAQEKKDLT